MVLNESQEYLIQLVEEDWSVKILQKWFKHNNRKKQYGKFFFFLQQHLSSTLEIQNYKKGE